MSLPVSRSEGRVATGEAPADASPRARTFVSAPELASLLGGPRPPVVLDVRSRPDGAGGRPEYEQGHIPGAVYVHLGSELQGPAGGLSGRRPLPDVAALQARARAWGINDGDAVVLYDNVAGTQAGRGWWVLRWAGLADVRLLDGGYGAWIAGGYPISTTDPRPAPGDVSLTPGHLPALDADGAAAHAAGGTLFDARGHEAYRAGHIPGSTPAPTRDNLTAGGLLLDEETLRRRFADLGIDGSAPIGVYCGGGVAAAHEAAVLATLGIPAALFVGSFSAWSADPARPVAESGSDR